MKLTKEQNELLLDIVKEKLDWLNDAISSYIESPEELREKANLIEIKDMLTIKLNKERRRLKSNG